MENIFFKSALKENVLRNTDNFLNAIINSIVAGYKPELIFNDIMDAVRAQEVTRGSFSATPEFLVKYFKEYLEAAKEIAEKMKESNFFEDPNRPRPRQKIKPYNENFYNKKTSKNEINKKAISADTALNSETDAEVVHRLTSSPEKQENISTFSDPEKPQEAKEKKEREVKVKEDWEKIEENNEFLKGELLIDLSSLAGEGILKEGDLDEEVIAYAIYNYLLQEHPKLKGFLKDVEYGDFEITDPYHGVVRMTYKVLKEK